MQLQPELPEAHLARITTATRITTRRHIKLAQVLAYLGEKDAAIAEGRRAVELRPESIDAFDGPMIAQGLAEVYATVGENEKAIDLLDGLPSRPSSVTVGMLQNALVGIRCAMNLASASCWINRVRKLSAAFLALASSVAIARGQWSVVSSEPDFSSGRVVEHKHVSARSSSGDEATVDLAIFSPKTATLRVIDRPEANDELASVMEREHCLAGVNGGYFDPNYAPVGLLISDSRTVAPQQKARLLSGVVSASNGRILVQRAAEFSAKTKPTAARQCGPFLVDAGKPIVGLNDTRSARRTFVAVIADGRALIGFSTHVTLAQLGSLLTTPELTGTAKVQRALNMDGGSSSGFWFSGERDVFAISGQKTVRDYLAVVPR